MGGFIVGHLFRDFMKTLATESTEPRAGSTTRAAAGSLAAAGHSSSLLVQVLGGVRRAFTEGRPC